MGQITINVGTFEAMCYYYTGTDFNSGYATSVIRSEMDNSGIAWTYDLMDLCLGYMNSTLTYYLGSIKKGEYCATFSTLLDDGSVFNMKIIIE